MEKKDLPPPYTEENKSHTTRESKEKQKQPLDTTCRTKDCDRQVDFRVLTTIFPLIGTLLDTKTAYTLGFCQNHMPKTSKFDECIVEKCKNRKTHGLGTLMTPPDLQVFVCCSEHSSSSNSSQTVEWTFNCLVDNLDLDQRLDSIFEPKLGTKEIAEFKNDNKCKNSCDHKCDVKKFSLLTRRHHCRRCGNSYCKKCCNTFVKLVGYSSQELLKVCNDCNLENIKDYNNEKEKVYQKLNGDAFGTTHYAPFHALDTTFGVIRRFTYIPNLSYRA